MIDRDHEEMKGQDYYHMMYSKPQLIYRFHNIVWDVHRGKDHKMGRKIIHFSREWLEPPIGFQPCWSFSKFSRLRAWIPAFSITPISALHVFCYIQWLTMSLRHPIVVAVHILTVVRPLADAGVGVGVGGGEGGICGVGSICGAGTDGALRKSLYFGSKDSLGVGACWD
jgi:hypothetical protein